MILNSITKLEAVLGGAVSANQAVILGSYVDYKEDGTVTRPAPIATATNDTTDVTVLAAPTGNNPIRELRSLWIFNNDTGSITLSLKTDDGTTERKWIETAIASKKTLYWEKENGWNVTT